MSERFLNSDEQLIRRLKKNDKEAFRLVFDRFKQKLYYFAMGYLHSVTDTEEIIQNVFVSLWENRHALKEEHSLKNYLYKVTVNQVYNLMKHQAVRRKYLENLILEEPVHEESEPQQNMLYNDLKETIDALISDLPEKQQVIFKLSRKEGLSNNEIAAQLGLSVRSVENQIYRALKYIKEKLRNQYLLAE